MSICCFLKSLCDYFWLNFVIKKILKAHYVHTFNLKNPHEVVHNATAQFLNPYQLLISAILLNISKDFYQENIVFES